MTETLPRAIQVLPAGGWVERTARHRVTLDFDDRFRRRKRYVAEDGFAFLLDLEEATALRQGDGLLLEKIPQSPAVPEFHAVYLGHIGSRLIEPVIGDGNPGKADIRN
jgi:hypothetical protein